MSNNKANILRISRFLTPEHQSDLLAFVHLSHAAEHAATRKTQEYSCKNNVQRSKK
jgi:hypothetical protein